MIPYFEIPSLHLGPITLHAFGALMALGVLVAGRIGLSRAERGHLDVELMRRALPWAVGAGIVGAHLLHVLAYHPEELRASGWALVKMWDGLSSFGGVLGGLVGTAIFLRRQGKPLLPYADALAYGLAPGWAIGRVGCFVAHDHRGRLTDFALAVRFPGGARHDLGLYEALLLGGIALGIAVAGRRPRPVGFALGAVALSYGVGRFALDYLRASDLAYVDARYGGLTPAQYLCVGLVGAGAWLLVRSRGTSRSGRS